MLRNGPADSATGTSNEDGLPVFIRVHGASASLPAVRAASSRRLDVLPLGLIMMC
jgi:hypothetical protein